MENLRNFFTQKEERELLLAIAQAESKTSGEIRVRIERLAGHNPMKTARKVFEKIGMRDTELHNGVLFMLSIEDKKFVILGDDAINEKVPENFWAEVREIMEIYFRKAAFAQGLAEGIRLTGLLLSKFFPHQRSDLDELPNAISYADED